MKKKPPASKDFLIELERATDEVLTITRGSFRGILEAGRELQTLLREVDAVDPSKLTPEDLEIIKNAIIESILEMDATFDGLEQRLKDSIEKTFKIYTLIDQEREKQNAKK
jgi:hypothetical protein